jgi:hypothetical protein
MSKVMEPTRALKRLFPNVTKVVCANKGVKVTVNDKDCDTGTKGAATECAMARAMRRQYKADACVIRLSDSYLIHGDTAVRFRTPESVAREIVSFDRHHDFAPGEYHLGPWASKERARDRRSSGAKHSGSRRAVVAVHKTTRVRREGKE